VARVVFVIVDALAHRHVNESTTPTLHALAREGGSALGRAVMTSATYPNHATFATGALPLDHGVVANWVVHEGRARPSYDIGPATPTIFDACRTAGRSSVAVLGDQNLIGIMGATSADQHWPPNGVLPDDVERDGHGYAANHEVLPRILGVLDGDRPDLFVAHINEPDTEAHIHGPDSPEALAAYRAADDCLQVIVDALRPTWDDTVLIVVSDHDQEEVDDAPIDLYEPVAQAGLPLIPIPEGSAAIVWGEDETNGRWLDAIDGVTGHRELAPGIRLVACAPRRWFNAPAGFMSGPADRGTHGGERTRSQVAVTAGGHPHADELARSLNDRGQIDAAEWAPAIARLLEIAL
jgi:hypothetical protein